MWVRLVFSFGLLNFLCILKFDAVIIYKKLWLALTFQSAILKQLVSYGFLSNNNNKHIATTYWLIAKSTGYPFLK